MYPQQPYAPAPAQPQYPPVAPYPPQNFQPPPPPQSYQYPPQQYAPAPPVPPPPPGTLDTFYQQPSTGGGAALKFNGKPIGTSYAGIVARKILDSDVRAQTDQAGRAVTFRDGRPKFVLVIPLRVAPSQEFPEGVATWWVKGQARDELTRAMAEAGAPAGPPEEGAGIRVTLIGMRPVPGMNPAFQYRIDYVRSLGAANGAPSTQPAPPAPMPPPPPPAPPPQPMPAPAPMYGPGDQQPPAAAFPVMPPAPPGFLAAPPPAVVPPPVPVQPVAPAAPAPQAAPLSPEQEALMARLTGSQQG